MKRYVLALSLLVASSNAYADSITIGCQLLSKYSDSDVGTLLNHARSVINEQEIGKIYYKYVTLKNACQTNANASRVVPVSAGLRNWLAQNGIDVNRLGKQL